VNDDTSYVSSAHSYMKKVGKALPKPGFESAFQRAKENYAHAVLAHKFRVSYEALIAIAGADAVPTHLRLPFGRTVVEYPLLNEKRFILATEVSADMARERGLMDGYPGLLIDAFHWDSSMGWSPSPVTVALWRAGEEDDLFARYSGWVDDLAPSTVERVNERAQQDVLALITTLAMLECANVSTRVVEPPPAANKLRAMNCKPPHSSYHVLVLPSSSSEGTAGLGGTHAPPRLHMRRGHIRRLPAGRSTWVRPHMVGRPELGVVSKDYRIGPDDGR
jgi:hypothetical protein